MNLEESYRIRNVGRNILAVSDERGIMINSVGHVVYELPFEGSGNSVAEIYQDRNGEIVSSFVRNDNFYVYRENQLKGTFQIIGDLEDIPESFLEVFKPLQIFQDGLGQMLLIVKEGESKDEIYLATYSIDLERLRSNKIASAIVSNSFDTNSRTKSNMLLINSKNGEIQALNPKNLSIKANW